MKVVLLAGGLGTRITEESQYKPKPMIEIGGMPILWHIMKYYSSYGFNEFIICAGYKQQVIKEWFANYFIYSSDVTFDFSKGNEVSVHNKHSDPWKVTVIDTGLNTGTGGRIKRVKDFIGDEDFCLTYGDGVSNVPLDELVQYHQSHGKLATLTLVNPAGRFGVTSVDQDNNITSFKEKSVEESGWINAGFMILKPEIIDYIEGDRTMLEQEPLQKLAEEGQLKGFKHYGFWQCMDMLRDKKKLEELWNGETPAPWKIWEK